MGIRSAASALARKRSSRLLGACLAVAAIAPFLASCEMQVFTVPSSIARDCSVNVSAPLNAWMASLPDFSELRFGGGCFRIDQTLELTDRNNFLIKGQGATFRTSDPTGDGSPLSDPSAAAPSRAHWRFEGGSNIEIRTLSIRGAHPNGGTDPSAYVEALEAQHGIDVRGTTGVSIADVTISDVYGDFVYFGKRGDAIASGRVYDGDFSRNGRQGISVAGGRDVMIENNVISDTRRATLDLEPTTTASTVERVTFRNNTVGTGRLLFVAAHSQAPIEDVVISGNRIEGRAMNMSVNGLETATHRRWAIIGNVADTTFGTVGPGGIMELDDVEGLWILDNVQPIQAGRNVSGVQLGPDVTGAVVNGNSFANAVSLLYLPNGTPEYVACGNQLLPGGLFDEPAPC